MKKNTILHNKRIYIFVLLVLLVVGYSSGKLVQKRAQISLLMDRNRFSLLITRSPYTFFSIYNKINSKNSLLRLSGYYALLDYNLVDLDFFIERYKREKQSVIKRTIIWILQFSEKNDRVVRFYDKSYQRAFPEVKREIVACMKKIAPVYYKQFVKKHKIK